MQESATLPLLVEHNRPFAHLTFRRPDGSLRPSQCLVDTGGGGFLLAESLARDLGVKQVGEAWTEGGRQYSPVEPPDVLASGMPLNLTGARCAMALGTARLSAGFLHDSMLPGHLLMRYHVVFDYVNGTLTLSRPGSAPGRGEAFPTPIHPRFGFPRIEVEIDGERCGMLLDTGASCTMVSEVLLRKWAARHPDWPRRVGAVGAANMGVPGEEQLPLMRIPQMRLGSFALDGVGVVARPEGTFERWMSQMTTAPIVGALAGNVLRGFRVEIDYSAQTTYLERLAAPTAGDLDLVGLTLRPAAGGCPMIAGVDAAYAGTVRPGDRLVRVADLWTEGLPLPSVVDSLRGIPGQAHTLAIERDGQMMTLTLPVLRLL